MMPSLEWANYISALAAIDLGTRLNESLSACGIPKLKSVYVIPSEITGNVGWGDANVWNQDQDALNRKLGEYGMMFIARDLAAELAVRTPSGPNGTTNGPFCIGIGTGSTMFHIVNSFQPTKLRASARVTPLVMGPSPETMHSAGFLAMLLQERLNAASTDFGGIEQRAERISEVTPFPAVHEAGYLKLQLKKEFAEFVKDNTGCLFAKKFNWIITGIGGKGHGQHEEHKKLYNINDEHAVGDICSRFFDRQGNESTAAKGSSDSIAIASFMGLQAMCETSGEGRRVILVGGGRLKYRALSALISRRNPIFNVLVTDELTVRQLLVDLKKALEKILAKARETQPKRGP
jgi:DNA-binding transcriptional regulator LsrR (DeoR family)